ncbi:ArsR/SmtB family transcription factor [Deinococcus metalli]|uniref:ArsR/SmtB family transcription factor n=1 Tax=Deinococcus metalli TaxID=1141878 RepID=UPI0036077BA4
MISASQDALCEEACVHPEAVRRAREALPDAECVDHASAFLKLVADPTRLKILSALNTGELCVCDLSLVVGISESAMSHQLRLLRTGRVGDVPQGGPAYYSLLDHHVTTLIGSALEHARSHDAA